MQFAERYIETAASIIGGYDGSLPLHHYLKQFFAAGKKYGSRDRKAIGHACYCFFRLGHSLTHLTELERVRAGVFLCTPQLAPWQSALSEEMKELAAAGLEKKLELMDRLYGFQARDIFPWHQELSAGIDAAEFCRSHLVQPDLHLRIRPGRAAKVKVALADAGISYVACGDDCIALPNGSRIDQLLQIDRDVVVQDLNSQRIGEFMPAGASQGRLKVWDSCAASGGKSILAVDLLGDIDLTVSDLRPTIILNLRKRFEQAGINHYQAFVADLANRRLPARLNAGAAYDRVICDAPCSGSGTWGRNPEQLYFFNEDKIRSYADLQKKILDNIREAVAPEGYLLYITCSVFRRENEEAVQFIGLNSDLKLQKSAVLKGYDKKADTMFAALFKRD